MTIRTRLTLWYAGILIVSLLVMGVGTYQEISEQLRQSHRREPAGTRAWRGRRNDFSSRPARRHFGIAWRLVADAPRAVAGDKTDGRRRKQSTNIISANSCPRTRQWRRTGPAHRGFQRHDRAAGRFVQSHPRIHPARLARIKNAAHHFVRRDGNRVARRIAFARPNANGC